MAARSRNTGRVADGNDIGASDHGQSRRQEGGGAGDAGGLGAGDAAAAAAGAPRRRIRVYRHMPLLDNVLTAMYLLQIVWVAYIFLHDQEALIQLALLFPAVALLVWVVKSGTVALAGPLGRALPGKPLKKPLARKKFAEQAWQLVIHLSMSLWEAYVLSSQPWMEDPRTCWIPNTAVQVVPPALKLLYLAQLAVWLYTCAIHRFFDERRKDYYVMYVHHVATIALVAGSAANNYYRVGLLVLFVHDASDIFVDLLKLVNYLALEGRKGFFASEIIFLVNLMAWMYLRLWVFPTQVLHSAIFYSRSVMNNEPYGSFLKTWDMNPDNVPMWFMTNSLLVLLFVLHVWWYYLFLRIAYKIVHGGAHQAGREEYEGDSD